MKPSGWTGFVVILHLLYALLLIVIPIYLLALGDGWGAIFASAALGGPGIVALIGWLGLRKGKLWGWCVALFADLVMFGILIYSLINDGWHNIDREMVGMTALAATISAAFFIPVVRRSYWQRVGRQPVLSS
jgi:cation transport ATPase